MPYNHKDDYPLKVFENVLDIDKKHRLTVVANRHGAVLLRFDAAYTSRTETVKYMVAMANKGVAA